MISKGTPGRWHARGGGVSPEDMQYNGSGRHKFPAHDSIDALESLDRPETLGVDKHGCVHHYSPYDDRVVVVNESGTVTRVETLANRDLSEWVGYVADRRGWADLRYARSLADFLQERLSA